MNDFLSVAEASFYTEKSEATIRRFISEHKSNKNDIKKINGKTHIRATFLSDYFSIKYDTQNSSTDTHTHEKEKASLILEKQNKDIINENQLIIKELIQAKNKRSFLPLYITLFFIILFCVAGLLAYAYRNELLSNSKRDIDNLRVNYSGNIKTLENAIKELKTQQNNNVLQYNESIKLLKENNNKVFELQRETIKQKELEILRLQALLDNINKNTTTDTDKL